MTAKGTFFPRRINDHVPNMEYAADVRFGGVGTIVIPAPAAADSDSIETALAGTVGVTDVAFEVDAKFGRNIVVTASAASGANSGVTVRGKDYLGQPMVETIAVANASGTTAQTGKKAFKYVESLEVSTATTGATFAVGTGDVLGLPYKAEALVVELVDKAKPSNAGSITAGLADGTTQSATTGDPRGTYSPHSSQKADGSKEYELTLKCDRGNLHGDAHYYA